MFSSSALFVTSLRLLLFSGFAAFCFELLRRGTGRAESLITPAYYCFANFFFCLSRSSSADLNSRSVQPCLPRWRSAGSRERYFPCFGPERARLTTLQSCKRTHCGLTNPWPRWERRTTAEMLTFNWTCIIYCGHQLWNSSNEQP